jgi:hypothetical protein
VTLADGVRLRLDVQFSDIPPLSIPQSDFQDFASGTVPGNLNDFYKQISYGRIDITDSQVFGPYPMRWAYSDLFDPTTISPKSSFIKTYSRWTWIEAAKALATPDGYSDKRYSGVIAIINGVADAAHHP